jgi:glycosyltransferase involved in cell wall biosynthesis
MHPDDARLVIITTAPLALWGFFQPQIRFLRRHGFDIHAVSSPGERLDECGANTGVSTHAIPMKRDISPFSDLMALFRLWRLLRALRPAIVHVHTPKAGLLGMLAATAAGVNLRIYTVHGLPAMTQSGWRRRVLHISDRVACLLATEVLCVSHSLRRVMIQAGLSPQWKLKTLGDGGCAGVELDRFDPAVRGAQDRRRIREKYGIPPHALLLGYVGRVVRDKGIEELAQSWKVLRERLPDLHLFLCGSFEPQDPVSDDAIRFLTNDPRVYATGEMVGDMPAIYAAIDLCVLPSYREGLATVLLECGAMKIAVVATEIPGCVDVVQNGTTGVLVPPGDAAALTGALESLLRRPEQRRRMGEAGRQFVQARFSAERVSGLILDEYQRLLEPSGRYPPQAAPLDAGRNTAAGS